MAGQARKDLAGFPPLGPLYYIYIEDTFCVEIIENVFLGYNDNPHPPRLKMAIGQVFRWKMR